MIFLAMASSSHAAGFRVALQSAKQLGMAHTGAGQNLGAESIFFNPGAVAMNEKGNISVSGNAIFANTKFNTPGSTYTTAIEDNIGTPFAAYGSMKLNDQWAAGLGVYTPFGNTVEWQEDWAGRFISQKVELQSIFIQPTVSYKVNDKLGIGAGFIYQLGTVDLTRAVPITSTPEPSVNLQNDDFATGYGYNLGVYYQVDEQVSVGINYRSRVDADLEDGNVTINNLPTGVPGFTATKVNAELPLPAELTIGTGLEINEKITLAADMNYTFWSSYETLTFNYNGDLGGSPTTAIPQEWDDTWTVRLGGDYAANDKLNLRAGAYYDFSPVPDANLSPITPDTDRLGLTAGVSYYASNQFSVDGGFLYLKGKERTVQASESVFGFGQRYNISTAIPSLGLNYSFK